MRLAHTIFRLGSIALASGLFLTGCATRDAHPPTTIAFHPAATVPVKPKPRVVRVSNERSVGGNQTKPEVDLEQVVSLVSSGKYLGLTEGKICFQPKNLDPRAPIPALLEDAVIGSTIQGKLSADQSLTPGAFSIKSRGGVVRVKAFNGDATTANVARVAEYALSVPGVVEVQLMVPISPKPQDAPIAASG